jgi:hypothetical protein
MTENSKVEPNFWEGDLLNRKGAANYLEAYLKGLYCNGLMFTDTSIGGIIT